MKQAILSGCLAAFVLALTGCQTISYYGQAIHGQCQMLNRQRPIETLLNDPAIPEPLKSRLRLVLEIRQFAERELQLPANGHYLNYADLGRPYAVWNVYAAPEFSLEAKSWWYPFVGRLEYRGYFSETSARRYAAKLKAEGLDVHVGGVSAYSTLGWFRDPVLNTFIDDSNSDLAELLFHELAHQKLFVAGDTDFNEAFATAVAEEGLRRWMRVRNDSSATADYEAEALRMKQFVELVTVASAKLEALYASSSSATGDLKPAQVDFLRREKLRITDELRSDYQRLRAEWGGRGDYDRWFGQSLNNAQLNTVDTYYSLVPAFRRLLQKHSNDLAGFYEEVRAISKLEEKERHQRLASGEEAIPGRPSTAAR